MDMNHIFEKAEEVLARARTDVESLESEVALRQEQLRKRRRAVTEREKALERTRKAWQAAAEQEELAESELESKLATIRNGHDGGTADPDAELEREEPAPRVSEAEEIADEPA